MAVHSGGMRRGKGVLHPAGRSVPGPGKESVFPHAPRENPAKLTGYALYRPGTRSPHPPSRSRRRLHRTDPDSGRRHSRNPERARRDRHRPDRHGQNGGLHPADSLARWLLPPAAPGKRRTRALILAPTRELVVQIEENLRAYAHHAAAGAWPRSTAESANARRSRRCGPAPKSSSPRPAA